MPETNLDDVWGSDSEFDIIHQDINKLRDQHSKRGYLDGIVSSKEVNLQQGFDDGFPTGAKLGHSVGLLIGRLQGLNLLYGSKDEDLANDFKEAQKELRINSILSKSIFNENFDLPSDNDNHELVEKWTEKVQCYCNKYNVKMTSI